MAIYATQVEELKGGYLKVLGPFTPPVTQVGNRFTFGRGEYRIESVMVKTERNIFGGKKETAIMMCKPAPNPSDEH